MHSPQAHRYVDLAPTLISSHPWGTEPPALPLLRPAGSQGTAIVNRHGARGPYCCSSLGQVHFY